MLLLFPNKSTLLPIRYIFLNLHSSHKTIVKLSLIFQKILAHYFFNNHTYLLYNISCLMSPMAHLLSHVSCLMFQVCCRKFLVSHLLYHVPCNLSHVSFLMSLCLLSLVYCLMSPVSRLLFPCFPLFLRHHDMHHLFVVPGRGVVALKMSLVPSTAKFAQINFRIFF